MSDDIKIEHNTEQQRYELYAGGELASVADYRPNADRLVFHHTETSPAHGGKGLAEKVVRFALDDVRSSGKTIVPTCWFVAEFVEANPAYADLAA